MRLSLLAFAVGFGLGVAAAPDPAQSRAGYTKGVANVALVAAARRTPLKAIDYGQDHCRNRRSLAQWLKELSGRQARAIRWRGGPCVLTNDLNPLDAGSDWCAQATIVLKHPRTRRDTPAIEVYFERPVHGRLKPAYAFRGAMLAADGENYSRSRREFEYDWTSRFPEARAVTRCPGDEDGDD